MLEEGPAVSGERAHRLAADAVMAERDAAPGAVIAERVLGLDDDHLAVPRQPGGGRQAGNAAADDDEVRAVHGGEKR